MSFSLWCDFVENHFLDTEFVELIASGKINGATSNPAIFKQAILNSPAYKAQIAKFKGKNAKDIYENLAVADIQKAADKLALNFFQKNDGFVSLEIDPRLYDNTALSLGEAKRLYTAIGKANVMMKIPATAQSYEVMSVLMSEGISVNATLIFSLQQAKACFDALNSGLKTFRAKNAKALKGGNLREPQGVISVFVSRFDRLLNKRVLFKNEVGILNASLCYHHIHAQNEPSIRTLFASTGVKGDDLPKDYYINELLFDECINTAPMDALRAFKGGTICENALIDKNSSACAKNAPQNECACKSAFADKKAQNGAGQNDDACESGAKFKTLLSKSEIHAKLRANLGNDELENACEFLLDDGLKQFCGAFEEILGAV